MPDKTTETPNAEKPRMMWHADADWRCHAGCEQWGVGPDPAHPGCKILDILPWEVFDRPTPAKRSMCPFAVIANVLGLAEQRAWMPKVL